MSRSGLAEFIETQCVQRLTAAAVYQEVKFGNRRPRYLEGLCPFASQESPPGSFVVDARTLRWSCLHHCRRGGQSLLAYLNGGQFPRPGSGELKTTIDKVARLAGVVPDIALEISPEDEAELASQERVSSLLETFLMQVRWLLLSAAIPARQAAKALLARHGLDTIPLEDSSFGLVADISAVHRALEGAGYCAQEIEASSLAHDERLAGRVIGPIRDRFGRILSFWARDPLGRAPKFLFKGPWKDETPLVGLDTAFMAAAPDRGHLDDLLVVERLFDALVLHGMGFPQAAAIAGPASDMTRTRWERLAGLGVQRVTLVPDGSESSRHNALTAVENAFRAERAPAVWVLLPEGLGQHPAAIALARACGLPALRSVLRARAVHGYHYKALSILRTHRPPSDWTDASRHAAWKEAIEFYATSNLNCRPRLDSHFVPAIVGGLQRTWETLQPLSQVSTDYRPALAASPRPPIPRPAATPDLVPSGNGKPRGQPTLPHETPQTISSGGGSGDRSDGFCWTHQCDTTVCFCFD